MGTLLPSTSRWKDHVARRRVSSESSEGALNVTILRDSLGESARRSV